MISILAVIAASILFGSFLRKAYDDYMLFKQQNVHVSIRIFEYSDATNSYMNNIREWFEKHPEFKLIKISRKCIQFGDRYEVKIVYKAPPGKQLAFSVGYGIEIVEAGPNTIS